MMEESEILFNTITNELTSEHAAVAAGKMMSSPGIKYKNKVFAFYYNDQMVFRLGKEFDPEVLGITQFGYLSPFKNKPPMKGWVEVPFVYHQKWRDLAALALEKIEKEIR
ncbi:hypothetical protein QQ020_11325 [Fulvivirgaceae bacterium BMA12]|uniref:Uncharacterized protein n=1 Tax=Agaribacillus aureus TaxID=3051825 RepID=A0ABT8L8T2_9BACT|nr:hypothetical protein [Fulvivirgaceae bacterium BMA12]